MLDLLKSENENLQKLHSIVSKAIREEKLVMENLLHPPKDILTGGQKVSDKMARFGGSWSFILIFFCILLVWISINVCLPVQSRFDPYPFILMNLVLSCVAAIQAPIIMMSQNRQEEIDRKRNENDFLINLKAEMEVRMINQKVDLLLEEQIKILIESQAKQLEILKTIEQKIESSK